MTVDPNKDKIPQIDAGEVNKYSKQKVFDNKILGRAMDAVWDFGKAAATVTSVRPGDTGFKLMTEASERAEGLVGATFVDGPAGFASGLGNMAMNAETSALILAGDAINLFTGPKGMANFISFAVSAELPSLGGVQKFYKDAEKPKVSDFEPVAGEHLTNLSKFLRATGFAMKAKQKYHNNKLRASTEVPFLFDVGNAVASTTPSVIAAIMGSPVAAGRVMTGQIFASEFSDLRAEGVELAPALFKSGLQAVGEGILEQIMFSTLYGLSKNFLLNGIIMGDKEAATEFMQEGWGEFLDKTLAGSDKTVGESLRNMAYSGLLGFISGGVMGATTIHWARKQIVDTLKKAGIPDRGVEAMADRVLNSGVASGAAMLNSLMGVDEQTLKEIDQLHEGGNTASVQQVLEKIQKGFEKQQDKAIFDVNQDELDDLDTSIGITPEEQVQFTEDESKVFDLLVKGRERDLAAQESQIMKDIKVAEDNLATAKKEGKPTVALKKKLISLNKQFDSLQAQFSDIFDVSQQELEGEDVKLKGRDVTKLQRDTRKRAEIDERKKLKEQFRNEKMDDKEARKLLTAHIRKFLPKSLREKAITALRDVKASNLDKALAKIDEIRTVHLSELLRKEIQKRLNKLAPVVESGKLKSKFVSLGLQKVGNEVVNISKLSQEQVSDMRATNIEKINKLLDSDLNRVDIAAELADLQFENDLLSKYGAMESRSVEELDAMLGDIKGLVKGLVLTNKFFKQVKKEALDAQKSRMIGDIDRTKGIPKNKVSKFLEGIKNLVITPAGNLGMLLNMMDQTKGPSLIQDFIERFDQAERIKQAFQARTMEQYKDLVKSTYDLKTDLEVDDKIQEMRSTKKTVKFQDNRGVDQELSLSKGQVVYLLAVANSGDPAALEALTGDNARLAADKKVKDLGLEPDSQEARDIYAEIKGNAISQVVLDSITNDTSFFSEEDKDFAANLYDVYESMYPFINKVYKSMYFVDLPQVQGRYVPFIRDVGEVSSIDDLYTANDDLMSRIFSTPGSVKVRRKNASSAFQFKDDIEVLLDFTSDMSAFVSYNPVIRELMPILRDKDVRQTINKVTGGRQETTPTGTTFKTSDYYKAILNRVELLGSNGKSQMQLSDSLKWVNQKLNVAMVGGKAINVVKQIASSLAALDFDVTTKDFIDGVNDIISDPDRIAEILEQSPIMKTRFRNMMIEFRDLLNDEKFLMAKKNRSFTDMMMWFVKTGNTAGIMIGGWSVFKAEMARTNDVGKAYAKFDDFVINSQQAANLTQVGGTQQGYGRLLFKFVSAPLQYMRITAQAMHEVQTGRISKARFLKKMWVFHVLLPVLYQAITKMFKMDKEELVRTAIVGPTKGVPLLGSIIDTMVLAAEVPLGVKSKKSFAENVPVYSTVASLHNAVSRMNSKAGREPDIDEVLNDLMDVFQDVTTPLGAPRVFWEVGKGANAVAAGDMPPEAMMAVILGYSKWTVDNFMKKEKGKRRR